MKHATPSNQYKDAGRGVCGVLVAVLLFCAPAWLGAAEKRPRVLTSFLPIYCWTAHVAGDFAEVENLLSAKAEPHEYAFAPGDARRLAQADLILVNGLSMEGWLPKFLRSTPAARERVVTVTAGLKGELIAGGHHHGHDHDHSAHDESAHANPHTWLDPQLAAHGVSNILAALQKLDPTHAAGYASNAHVYLAKLRQLDIDIRQSLAGLTNRAVVTYHDAFPYFARRYGFEIAGVVEEVPDVSPTGRHLTQLGRTMRERKIRAIFIPPGGASRVARQLATDLRATLGELDTLESGTASPAAYEERMRANARSLLQHLK